MLRGKRVIACNNAWKLGPWDFCYIKDTAWWNQYHAEILPSFGGIIVTSDQHGPKAPRVRFLKRGKRIGLELRPDYSLVLNNAGLEALNLAVKFGVKKIVMIGFDMKQDENGNQNYHNEHKRIMDAHVNDRHRKFFPQFYHAALAHGVEIFNTSLESTIDVIPKAPLSEFI